MTAPTGGEADNEPQGHDARTQTGKALLLVAVVVVIAILVLDRSPTKTARTTRATTTTTAPAPSTTTTTVPAHPPSQVTVQVLNGLQTGLLAGDLTTKLHNDEGYKVLPPNNTTTRTTVSGIYVAKAGYHPAAEALARTLGLPRSAVHRRLSGAPVPSGVVGKADLIVVIGTSLASRA